MRFTSETMEKINKEYWDVKKERNYRHGKRGLYITDNFEASVYAGGREGCQNSGWFLSNVEDLRATIEELEMFAEAITRVTGVVV